MGTNMNDIFETKLTRTEVLDLILDELTEELNSQIEPIEKELEALPGSDKIKADFALFAKKLTSQKVSIDEPYDWDSGDYTVSVQVKMPRSALPAEIRDVLVKRRKLETQKEAIQEQLRKLTNSKVRARNELIRKSLEASSEGKEIIARLTEFKFALRPKLLGAGK
jgi:hypothetical protein